MTTGWKASDRLGDKVRDEEGLAMTIGSLLVPDLVYRTIIKDDDSHIQGQTTEDMRIRSDDEQGRAETCRDVQGCARTSDDGLT